MSGVFYRFEEFRSAFESVPAGDPLSCLVIHAAQSEKSRLSEPTHVLPGAAKVEVGRSGLYSIWRAASESSDRGALASDESLSDPWCDVYVSEDETSEILGFMPTFRRVVFHGDIRRSTVFFDLAKDVGICLRGLPEQVLAQFPSVALTEMEDAYRWLWVLFELAWQRRPHSPLQAERRVWSGVNSAPYDLAYFKSQKEMGILHPAFPPSWAEQLPAFFYSEVRDVFRASAYALDMLLEDVNSAGADAAESQCQSQRRRMPGRKPEYDPAEDARLVSAWKASGYRSLSEFARKSGIATLKLKRAVDRHRHRDASDRRTE